MESEDILKRLDRIDDLPTLDTIAIEVNKMLQDQDTSVRKLSDAVEKDQAIALRLLKLVNSAFFGFRSKISNIPHAVTLLGFNTVRNAVISLSVIKAFHVKETFGGFNITDFWTHSIAAAITSRHLAEKARFHFPDNCFIGGLLHDIGKVVLFQYFPDLFKKVWTSALENNLDFYEAEKKEIPVNHAQIGGRLAKKWQLPMGLIDAIRYHHAVTRSTHDSNVLMIVHVADAIVNRYRDDSKEALDFSTIYPEAARIMAPEIQTVSEWFPELTPEIEDACQFFLKEGA